VPQKVWYTDWVVHIEPVGKGRSALKYLAPYIFRVAISNKRILRFEDGKVTFTYKDAKGRWHSVTLEAENFIRRFLQHVLPKRFVKVRYYGFLSPRKRALLHAIQQLFALFASEPQTSISAGNLAAAVHILRCPNCGTEMVFLQQIKSEPPALSEAKGRRAPPWLST
jgi:hypothetical protein